MAHRTPWSCSSPHVTHTQNLHAAAQVDFLASKALSAEELAAQRERLQALTKATRVVELDLDGERVSVRPFLAGVTAVDLRLDRGGV